MVAWIHSTFSVVYPGAGYFTFECKMWISPEILYFFSRFRSEQTTSAVSRNHWNCLCDCRRFRQRRRGRRHRLHRTLQPHGRGATCSEVLHSRRRELGRLFGKWRNIELVRFWLWKEPVNICNYTGSCFVQRKASGWPCIRVITQYL